LALSRRNFVKLIGLTGAALLAPSFPVNAKQYLTVEQAKKSLWGDKQLSKITVDLTEEQVKAIRSAANGIRVRIPNMNIWKVDGGGWFIVDQIVGKHEFIDVAFAYYEDGSVKDFEVLVYRETYGYEVANPKWRAQFHKTNYKEFLKLDKQIQNISGATLSCRHITDGINRLNQTWYLVLQHLS
jgi:mRNA-degrading endonuclease RelE of RelBE toxin-antitoxin system